jgi:hypothetical protein
LGALTPASLSSEIEKAEALQVKIRQLLNEISEIRNQRDMVCIGIWDKAKRARASIKGIYGDDSIEYSLPGGTRLSERKPARRNPRVEQASVNSQQDGKVLGEEK